MEDMTFFSGKKLIQLPYSSFVPKKKAANPWIIIPPRLSHLPAEFLWDVVAGGAQGERLFFDLQTFFHETIAPRNGQNGVPFTLATTCPMPHQHPPLTKSQGDNSVFCGPTRFHGWWWFSPWKCVKKDEGVPSFRDNSSWHLRCWCETLLACGWQNAFDPS